MRGSMRRLQTLLLLWGIGVLTGCSNAPLANLMDGISPSRVRPEPNLRQERGPTPPSIPPVDTEVPVPPRPRMRLDNEPVSPVPPKGRSDDTSLPPLPPPPSDRE